MSTNKSAKDLEDLMRINFPGMEHYFVQPMYQPIPQKFKRQGQSDPHDGHHFFVYCGYVDSLLAPVNAQCWRSVSVDGCFRLVLAEDPDFVHDADCIPETRRRFSF